jgi:Asp-tRNA(Asn)/Glu-tRNA(Gln) amidotransferase A subunit family amidase
MNTIFAEAAAAFEDLTLTDRDDELGWQEAGAWPNTFRKARFLSAVDHVQLDRLRRQVMQEMEAAFREVDVVIGPAMAGPMLVITNFTGHPCLALRSAFRQSETRGVLSLARARVEEGSTVGGRLHTVPHGVAIWGRLFEEGTVLRVGRALERSWDVWGRRPPMPLE